MSHRYKEEAQGTTSSPESDSNRSTSVTGPKKRPSRAGTRSVSTLSAAQLERKRANDREAQRAIRQRTKEHIEKLERRIAELTANEEPNDQLVQALRRVKDLEEENALLRMKLEHANIPIGVPESGMRVASPWDDAVGGRQHLAGEGLHALGGQQIPSMLTSPGSDTSRASNPFPYQQQSSHWQGAGPFSANQAPKAEGGSGGDVPSEDFSAWAMDRRRFSGADMPAPGGQMDYSHVFGAGQSQSSTARTSSPISYGQLHEGHLQQQQQQQQQHRRTPGLGASAQIGEYSSSRQQQQQQQQQQQFVQPSQQQQQQQPTQQQQTQYSFHQPQVQPGQLPPRTQHEQPPLYYGPYSQG